MKPVRLKLGIIVADMKVEGDPLAITSMIIEPIYAKLFKRR